MPADRRPDRKTDRRTDRKPDRRGGRRDRIGTRSDRLDSPLGRGRGLRGPSVDPETFGRWSERFARFMGTAWFIVGMTVFVVGWLLWNTMAPPAWQFDPKTLNFTLLTLILSLQASYAAPLILLAQNRQDDRDRVAFEHDRGQAERGLADTEYLTREIAALRIAMGDVATRDFVRSELRSLLEEMAQQQSEDKSQQRDTSSGSS
ncbi:DUF1003 domain-containing protein [Spongisporangium articulatum]|uniref:DUF1003 domain-containing protein n=1 Tax=Spongisporangium articulatum TaxID=3362603 RepID=A0ABW8AQ60_9ACTN